LEKLFEIIQVVRHSFLLSELFIRLRELSVVISINVHQGQTAAPPLLIIVGKLLQQSGVDCCNQSQSATGVPQLVPIGDALVTEHRS
jgi:hypothetical protein